jgi:hypothetical protein
LNLSRRNFALSIVAAGVAASSSASTEPLPEVEARINWIVGKYGARLSEEQRNDIRRLITSGQAGIDAMRAFLLDNSAQP